MSKNESLRSNINKSLTKIFAISVMGMISITSVFTAFASGKRVVILCDGNKLSINTSLSDTKSILEHQNIKINDDDVILRNDSPNCDEIKIIVKRAYEVPIIVDGVKISVNMVEGTVQDAISKANIQLEENDKVIPGLNTNLFNGISLEVVRQKKINLTVNGVTKQVIVKNGLVKDALEQMNIAVGENDILNVDLNENLQNGMDVTLDVVNFTDEKREEKIPFKTIEEKTDKLFEGCSEIKTPGIEGIEEVVITKKTINDQLVEENIKNKEIKKEPQNEVKLVGTKKRSTSCCANINESAGCIVDSNGNKFSYRRKIVGKCTAYTAPAGAHTASGEIAQFGRVAVNPNVIPLGSKLYICSEDGSFVYGEATASDTGGALFSGKVLVDLFYPSEAECTRFGVRNLAVYVA